MTKKEMIEHSRRKLAEFAALPPDEQLRRMVEWGTVNERGEVLMGLKEAKEQEAHERAQIGSQNGDPFAPHL